MLSHLSILAALVATIAADISEPFHLALKSDNETYNGKAVTTCHQGASITSLCASSDPVNFTLPAPFAINVTGTGRPEDSGILSLHVSGEDYFPMSFPFNAYSNIAQGYFAPPGTKDLGAPASNLLIDEDGNLVMGPPIMDDSMAPNWMVVPSNETLSRWYVCDTFAPAAYPSKAVVWGLGQEKPQNPTCVKVDVVEAVEA